MAARTCGHTHRNQAGKEGRIKSIIFVIQTLSQVTANKACPTHSTPKKLNKQLPKRKSAMKRYWKLDEQFEKQ